eukprot:m51a1_g3920 hypothetical protein (185) ;mRNA; r:177155-177822
MATPMGPATLFCAVVLLCWPSLAYEDVVNVNQRLESDIAHRIGWKRDYSFKSADLVSTSGDIVFCASSGGVCNINSCISSSWLAAQITASDCKLSSNVKLCIVPLNSFFSTTVVGTITVDVDDDDEVLLTVLLVVGGVAAFGIVCGIVAYLIVSHNRRARSESGTIFVTQPGPAVVFRPLNDRV